MWSRADSRSTGHAQHPWIVIVEPEPDARLLVVVTVYEVSE
jgi:hypothetical protein